MAKKLSDVKVRVEVWLHPEDNQRVMRLVRATRKTRAGWMRDEILRAVARVEAADRKSGIDS
jgi:hypothetical protein